MEPSDLKISISVESYDEKTAENYRNFYDAKKRIIFALQTYEQSSKTHPKIIHAVHSSQHNQSYDPNPSSRRHDLGHQSVIRMQWPCNLRKYQKNSSS